MKNILHLCESSDTGGAESVLISLVERLDKTKYNSMVCLLSEGWLGPQLRKRGIETVVIPQPSSLDVAWLLRLRRLLRDRHISVMHSHEFATNVYASFLSTLTGVPVVATAHGKNYYADKWRRRAAYRFVARKSTMVVVSADLKRFMVDRVGIPASNIRVVHNGIDLRRYAASGKRSAIRAELGIGASQTVIGTVGNLFGVKGQTYLLKAFKDVITAFPDLILLMAGDGDQMEPLKREAAELGIAGNVRFLGFRDDVPALLQAMDIFVLPSLSEGLPLSILEALALEKPVVATNVGGVSEIMEHGVNGYMVPAGDPHALGDAILTLINEPDLAMRIGQAGRKRVEDAFSLEKMVREYEVLYAEHG